MNVGLREFFRARRLRQHRENRSAAKAPNITPGKKPARRAFVGKSARFVVTAAPPEFRLLEAELAFEAAAGLGLAGSACDTGETTFVEDAGVETDVPVDVGTVVEVDTDADAADNLDEDVDVAAGEGRIEVAFAAVAVSSAHRLLLWHVYPNGQQALPHCGNWSLSRVVFTALVGCAEASCSCTSQVMGWMYVQL